MPRLLFVTFAVMMLCVRFDYAQAPPAFEVTSVKPVQSATTSWTMGCVANTGRCTGANVTVINLIAQAYNFPSATALQRISGLPGWAGTQRFDIEAKAANSGATEAELKLMLRQLLAERFKVKLHEAERQVDGYDLVVSKRGPKLTKLGDEKRVPDVTLALRATTTDSLASSLATRLQRPVVNKTSITGNYDFRISMESISQETGGASLFTVLEEQYGLKLESQKVPIKVLIIDSIEQPNPN